MAEQGHNAHEVSRWMGHGRITVTMDVYMHLFPDDDGLADQSGRSLQRCTGKH